MLDSEHQDAISTFATPRVLVREQSGVWNTAIRRGLGAPVDLVSDLEQMFRKSIEYPGSAGVVELTLVDMAATCCRVADQANSPAQFQLFAVGDQELEPWRPAIRFAGFAALFTSLMEVPRLNKLIKRHLSSVRLSPITLEQHIEANLPWAGENEKILSHQKNPSKKSQ